MKFSISVIEILFSLGTKSLAYIPASRHLQGVVCSTHCKRLRNKYIVLVGKFKIRKTRWVDLDVDGATI